MVYFLDHVGEEHYNLRKRVDPPQQYFAQVEDGQED